MNQKDSIIFCLATPLVNLFKPQNEPVLFNDSLLVPLGKNKKVEVKGDLLKLVNYYDFNVDHCNPQDRKILYNIGKELTFDVKHVGKLSTRIKPLAKFPKSAAIMSSGFSAGFPKVQNVKEIQNKIVVI